MTASVKQSDNIEDIKVLEKRILKEINKVEKLEKILLGEEEIVIKDQNQVMAGFRVFLEWRNNLAHKIFAHKGIFSVILATGVILVTRGVWELSTHLPYLSSSLIALICGVVILLVLNRYPTIP